jgi:hypothetical protein
MSSLCLLLQCRRRSALTSWSPWSRTWFGSTRLRERRCRKSWPAFMPSARPSTSQSYAPVSSTRPIPTSSASFALLLIGLVGSCILYVMSLLYPSHHLAQLSFPIGAACISCSSFIVLNSSVGTVSRHQLRGTKCDILQTKDITN